MTVFMTVFGTKIRNHEDAGQGIVEFVELDSDSQPSSACDRLLALSALGGQGVIQCSNLLRK